MLHMRVEVRAQKERQGGRHTVVSASKASMKLKVPDFVSITPHAVVFCPSSTPRMRLFYDAHHLCPIQRPEADLLSLLLFDLQKRTARLSSGRRKGDVGQCCRVHDVAPFHEKYLWLGGCESREERKPGLRKGREFVCHGFCFVEFW